MYTATTLFSIRNFLLQDLDVINTPLFSIDNAPTTKDKYLVAAFQRKVGEKAMHSYVNNVFAYCTLLVDNDIEDREEIMAKVGREVIYKANILKTYLDFFWFSKDNSVGIDDTYGYIPEIDKMVWLANHTINSNNVGSFESTSFSEEEIRYSFNVLTKYNEVCPNNVISPDDFDSFKKDNVIPAKGVLKGGYPNENIGENNLQRAMSFLSTARCTSYLPYKIALYMPVLESLFTTSAAEVTQKVSERAAFYIGNDKQEKSDIFDTIKKAYDLRSNFFHGNKIYTKKFKAEHVPALSTKVDEITRRVLTKIIMEDSDKFLQKSEKDLNEFLSSIIFQ